MLHIKNLKIKFSDASGGEAVRGISLDMNKGDMLGLVGESGSGKTVTALTIAGLIDRGRACTSGEILFGGKNLLSMDRSELRKIQGRDIGVVFQEPMTALNPLMKVGTQIEEPLRIHTKLTPAQRRFIALDFMHRVELPEPEQAYEKYPHQLSGGQRQRAIIASAIIMGPQLLIADEPTTALDVSVQGHILKLLKDINKQQHVGILFISHNLSVVKRLCTRVAVMHDGRIVESGETDTVFTNPRADYTKHLISAIPTRDRRRRAL